MTERQGWTPRRAADELPGLVASPALAELLANLEAADRANARATAILSDLHRSGEVEEATGVAVELWLLSVGATRSDRRMLSTAAVQLDRLPSVRDGFDRGILSWSQVRTLCLLAERLSSDDAAELDLTLAPTIERYAGADADALLGVARQIVDRLRERDTVEAVERAERGSFLSFQPRMDGTGAEVYGDLDGLGYGLVSAALDRGGPLPSRRRDLVVQRPSAHDGSRDDATSEGRRARGQHRADRLVQLCADDLARHGSPFAPVPAPVVAGAVVGTLGAAGSHDPPGHATVDDRHDRDGSLDRDDREARDGRLDRTRHLAPEAILLLSEEQLLGADRLPAELLTKVTGGRLKVSSDTARRWIDEAGARIRTIVLDDTGQVLGVGTRTRVPPGWLADTKLATDAVCCAPGCRTAARACDLDHHTPVHPVRPDAPVGPTDIVNLGPMCRSDNIDKERQGWQVREEADGTVSWRHDRSGIHLRTVPWARQRAAARPPGAGPPRRRPTPAPPTPTSAARRVQPPADPDPTVG
ncbi:MAG: hypothetical protein WEB09_06875 [Nitriliruptor sp.]